jgi:hypothetical protein
LKIALNPQSKKAAAQHQLSFFLTQVLPKIAQQQGHPSP